MSRSLLPGVLRLNAIAIALTLGLTCALGIFLMTNWLVLAGGHVTETGERIVGPHLQLLSQFFIGYRVSFLGSIVGALYGFASGGVIGFLIGWVYNRVAAFRNRGVDGSMVKK